MSNTARYMQTTRAEERASAQATETDQDLLARFEDSLGNTRTEKTVGNYRLSILQFTAFLESRHGANPTSLWDARRADVDAWSTFMRRERHNAPNTRRLRLYGLKSISEYAHLPIEGEIVLPPRDRSASETKKREHVLEEEEYSSLMSGLGKAYKRNLDARTTPRVKNNLVVWLLMETGIRLSEATGTNLEDLYLNPATKRPTISIHGKGLRERTMEISQSLWDAIHTYIDDLRGHPEVDALFITSKGTRIKPKTIRTVVYNTTARYARRAIPPHGIRRSTATHWSRKGFSTKQIQTWLGHADSATTAMCYLHVTEHDQALNDALRLGYATPEAGTTAPTGDLNARLEGIKKAVKLGLFTEDEGKAEARKILGIM